MLFKNATFYTFSTMPEIHSEALEKHVFTHCRANDAMSSGFVIPNGFDSLVGRSLCQKLLIICLQVEEKILPSAVIARAVAVRVADIEEAEDRKPGRKERLELKDELTFELLPKAFSKYRKTHAIIDLENHLVIVEGSANKGDEITCALREALGSLPVWPVSTKLSPSFVTTDWLTNGSQPAGVSFGDYCKLEEPHDGGAVITCRNDEPRGDQVAAHLAAGLLVVELELDMGAVFFVLTNSLAFKSIRFTDLSIDDALADAEDAYEVAQANLLLFASTIAAAIKALTTAFGDGVQPELSIAPEAKPAPAPAQAPATIDDVAKYVVETKRASVSSVQRKFRIGYNRAAEFISELEVSGVVSPMASDGSRQVLKNTPTQIGA